MFFNKERIQSAAGSREIIFWGCSEDWIPKSKKLLKQVHRVVDIKYHEFEKTWMGLTVLPPATVKERPNDFFVVITTGSFDSVSAQLIEFGFQPEIDFCYSPFFEDFSAAQRINDLTFNLIFISSDYGIIGSNRASLRGGGIYELSVINGQSKIEKRVNGSYRQAQRDGEEVYAVEYVRGELHVFDLDFNLIKTKKLSMRHYTGLSVGDGAIYLVSSANDVIQVLNKETFSESCVIPFSNKSFSGEGVHHLNDCYYHDGRLFFSYFSKSGVWRNEVFDGGISYLDIETNEIIEVLSGLMQPHSPKIINDTLHFCESPKGVVYSSSWNKIASLQGFVRGINYHNGYYFIGQSETLYMKRALSMNNTMMNAGIYVMDESTGACRFFNIEGLKNVHTIISCR